jgi:hypothetical protein
MEKSLSCHTVGMTPRMNGHGIMAYVMFLNVRHFAQALSASKQCSRLIFATVSVVALNCMRQRIQLLERDDYVRIVAKVPADLEHACRRLANNEGWGLRDLCRSLIVLGACASYLTLRSSEPPQPMSDGRFSSVLKEYLGAQVYAPRTGRSSKVMTVRLPTGVARMLALYSQLIASLRSHVYTRLLRAGLLMYLTSEQRLAKNLKAASPRAGVGANHCGR